MEETDVDDCHLSIQNADSQHFLPKEKENGETTINGKSIVLPKDGGDDDDDYDDEENPRVFFQQQRVIIEGLDSATVVGIAFASFIIGIVLVGVLWFIHSHTGPVKNGSSSRSSRSEVNASGDITPNSSSPMTA